MRQYDGWWSGSARTYSHGCCPSIAAPVLCRMQRSRRAWWGDAVLWAAAEQLLAMKPSACPLLSSLVARCDAPGRVASCWRGLPRPNPLPCWRSVHQSSYPSKRLRHASQTPRCFPETRPRDVRRGVRRKLQRAMMCGWQWGTRTQRAWKPQYIT